MKPREWIAITAVTGLVAVVSYRTGARRAGPEQRSPAAVEAVPGGLRPPVPGVERTRRPVENAKDPALHWEKRIAAVRELPSPLGEAALEDLLAFLRIAPEGPRNQWYLVCNEIMEVLRKRDLAPGVYTRKMLGLIQDAGADPVIRDYAVQTLAQWVAGLDPNLGSERDAATARDAIEAMLVETQKPANGSLTLVGTTLHACADATINGNAAMQANGPKVAEAALALASGKTTVSPVNRAAAIQAAARFEVAELPQVCRAILQDSESPGDVRLSAIAALGQIGGPEDAALLQELSREPRFQYAAAAALKRLGNR